MAKIGVFPTAETLIALPDGELDAKADPDVFRHAVLRHMAGAGATFDLAVQLATDLDSMPVEDASRRWSEEESPYRTVARITFPPQTSWSEARAAVYDERVSFNPANSLQAHRPLGSVMRARLFVYARLSAWRREANGAPPLAPATLADVPD